MEPVTMSTNLRDMLLVLRRIPEVSALQWSVEQLRISDDSEVWRQECLRRSDDLQRVLDGLGVRTESQCPEDSVWSVYLDVGGVVLASGVKLPGPVIADCRPSKHEDAFRFTADQTTNQVNNSRSKL